YPRQEGYSYFLIDAPRGRETEVRDLLNIAFADRGLDVTFAKDRLPSYLAVGNTYLSTFQVLGGVGPLLRGSGASGLLVRGGVGTPRRTRPLTGARLSPTGPRRDGVCGERAAPGDRARGGRRGGTRIGRAARFAR